MKKVFVKLLILAIVLLTAVCLLAACNTDEEVHVHSWSDWVTLNNSTCSSMGLQKRGCACGKSEAKALDYLPHEEVIDKGVDATCTKSGLTEGKHCSVCNKVIVKQEVIEALGHTEEIIKGVEAFCTASGLSDGKKCSVCDTVLVKQKATTTKGHTIVVDNAVAATCTETGLTEGTHCSVCNKVIVKQEEVAKKDHSFGQWVILTKSTCTTEGKRERTCKCGEKETETIDALDHLYTKSTIKPTCTSEGFTEFLCTRCNDCYKDEYTDKNEHSINSNGICSGCNTDFSLDIEDALKNGNFSWRVTDEKIYGYTYHIEATYNPTNFTGKDIKIIYVNLLYLNRVGDTVYSTTYKFTGPYTPGQTISMKMKVGDSTFSFWNTVTSAGEEVTDVKIGKITIEYFDGSKDICK